MSERDPIETLRALLSEATPGPWTAEPNTREPCSGWAWRVVGIGHVADGAGGNDARLIAALRNLAPRLLAVAETVERMRRRYAYARDGEVTVDGLRALWDASDALRADAAEVLR